MFELISSGFPYLTGKIYNKINIGLLQCSTLVNLLNVYCMNGQKQKKICLRTTIVRIKY